MLSELLSTILVELNQYVHQMDGQPAGSPDVAIAANIGLREDPAASAEMENMVVLTLVNLEEETALKNGHSLARPSAGGVGYFAPPIFLNLFLLFSANHRNYQTAMTRLGQIISFFQSKNTFNASNSPGGRLEPTEGVSVTLSLLSLTMEQLNHLWGSLGGKQVPFVLYCGRLLVVQDTRSVAAGGRVEEAVLVSRGVSP